MYTVVEFIHQNQEIEVVRDEWIEKDLDLCFFPTMQSYSKVIKKAIPAKIYKEWQSYPVVVVKSDFGNETFNFFKIIIIKYYFFY
jgi:hypothetical protein